MKDIKTILIIALAIIIMLLFTCNNGNDSEVKEVLRYRTDSVYVYTSDTIKDTIKVPFASPPIHDTVVLYGDLKTYKYHKDDSLLSYDIEVDTDCYPDDVRMSYELKQFTIHDTVSTYIRDSVYQEGIPKSFLSIGATMIGNGESFGFAPQLMYSHKKGNNYSIGYDVMNKSLLVGFTKKISRN